MSTVLVTGGAGFVGAALVKELLSAGHHVSVLDDFSRGKANRLPDNRRLRILHADVRRRDAVAEAMQGCDIIFHLAYVQGTQTFYAEPRLVIDIALTGIMNILHACEEQGGKSLFLVSSSEVYQVPPMVPTDETVPLSIPDVLNPRYSYGGGKQASEIATLAYARAGVLDRAVILRPHNIYGPDMGNEHVIPEFANRMRTLKGTDFPIQGTGQETRSFCYVDDCTAAFMIALDKGADQTVYHVGTQEEVTIAELAVLVGQHYGKDIRVVPGTLPKGSPPRRLPDIGRMRALGYEPQIPLSSGLPPTLDWYANAA